MFVFVFVFVFVLCLVKMLGVRVCGRGGGVSPESKSSARSPEAGIRAPETRSGNGVCFHHWQRRMQGSNEALVAPQDGSRCGWCVPCLRVDRN